MRADITVNKKYAIGEIDNRIYGSFNDHIGSAVYEGLYEPEHPKSDDMGFRKDVIELVKKLGVTLVRYPGGNFVSEYKWEDGTGDKSKRPRKINSAWQSIETNEVGIDEFQEWAKRTNTDVMMAVNLGTRGSEEAQNCVEYCNLNTDTYYADMRRKNGFRNPFGIKTWCLGNEMGGLGQIGRKTADEYGKIALEAAKHMKRADSSIELSVSGSSHMRMPGFIDWDLTVLDYTYEHVDYISVHQYYSNSCSIPDYLARAISLDNHIKSIASVCDAIKAKKRSDKIVNISFDEWNVWTDGILDNIPAWEKAPHIAEMTYTLADALVVGTMLMTFQNNCDRVKIACIAQLINAIAPIMTEAGGGVWLQTIFYPFMYASRLGRGRTMKTVVKSDTYSTEKNKNIPYLESSVIYNEEKREIVVFAVNRSLTEDMELDISFENFGECILAQHIELYNDDLNASNSMENTNVSPENVKIGDKIILKKHSWNMLNFSIDN